MVDVTGTSVTLMVDNLEQSVAFYTGRLGFGLEYSAAPHFVMIALGGLRVGLHPRGGNPSAGDCGGISIGLEVDDIEASVAALQERGVTFPSGMVEDGPIRRADFRDPDGTRLYLVQTRGG